VLNSPKAVALAVGMNPHLSDLDPYQSALHAVDEALRNIIAVGGDLERTAILDNFCWGNCNKPDRMGSFVQAAKACYDAAMSYQTPFVSGKDSLNNEFVTQEGQNITIPGTLLVSAMSVIADAGRCISSDAKAVGNHIFIVGASGPELGGSHYLLAEGLPTGNDVPPVNPAGHRRQMAAVQEAIAAGAVRACHDLSEGGLAVAAAEMAFGGELGIELDLAALPVSRNGFDRAKSLGAAAMLFGESAGRFLCEVPPEKFDAFCRAMGEVPFAELGRVTEHPHLVIRGLGGGKNLLIDVGIHELRQAWNSGSNQ
jgi:phosphoribosylformylglycinamidine synthase subunit PurSL